MARNTTAKHSITIAPGTIPLAKKYNPVNARMPAAIKKGKVLEA